MQTFLNLNFVPRTLSKEFMNYGCYFMKYFRYLYRTIQDSEKMANLQVKDIDDNLYRALRIRAKSKRRSISQEVIRIIEDYLNQPEYVRIKSTQQFLSLSWQSDLDESADDIIIKMKRERRESKKFTEDKNVFD